MATLILDNFNDAGGTELDAHAIDTINTVGAAWVAILADIQIGSGGFANSAVSVSQTSFPSGDALGLGSGVLYVLDSTVSDCTIFSNCNTAFDHPGIVFRYVDVNNYWYAIAFGSGMYLVEVTSGTGTIRGHPAITQDNTFSVVLSGTSILFGSQALEGSYTSSAHQTATKHGLYSGFYNDGFWFDFEIDGTSGPAASPVLNDLEHTAQHQAIMAM